MPAQNNFPVGMRNVGVRCAGFFLAIGLLLALAQPAAADVIPDEASPTDEMMGGGGAYFDIDGPPLPTPTIETPPVFDSGNTVSLKACGFGTVVVTAACIVLSPKPCANVMLSGARIFVDYSHGGPYVQAGSGPGGEAGYSDLCN